MFTRKLFLALFIGMSLTACGSGGSTGETAVGASVSPLDLSGSSRAAPPTMGALET